MLNAEQRRDIGVDHPAVAEHEDVAVGVGHQQPFDDGVDARPERPELLDERCVTPDRFLIADPVQHLLVRGEDLLERLALPLAEVGLGEVLLHLHLDPGGIGVGRRGLARPEQRRGGYDRGLGHAAEPAGEQRRLLPPALAQRRVPLLATSARRRSC
jgi:hypothetical protein